jgi:uncharacterized protein YggE
MNIQNINYSYSKYIEAQNEARLKSLLVAQKKAQAMTKALNVGLGDLLVIEDNQAYPAPRYSKMLMASDAGGRSGSQEPGGFALGKIKIKGNVKVVYEIGSSGS